jgi:hypothetical protein
MQTSNTFLHSDAAAVRKPTHDDIARAAYRLYLEQGSQHGHDLDDWLRAEQMLLQQLNESAVPRTAASEQLTRQSFNGVPAFDYHNHPAARDERRASDREDIRRKTSPFRAAPRQTHSGHQNGKHPAVVKT